MSLTLLKHNADVLVEVVQNYELLVRKKATTKDPSIDAKLNFLKNQIVFLLAAIKKEVEQEKNA